MNPEKRCRHCNGTGIKPPKVKRPRVALPFAKPRARAAEKREQKTAHRVSTSEIRTAVMERADGRCECGCGIVAFLRLELDHFWGGSGRRRHVQSVETCWALLPRHHQDKTENYPSAAAWREKWAAHCAKCGYPSERPALRKQSIAGAP